MDDGEKQLAGAFYGMSGIPADWRDKLALKGLIESMAEELFDMSKRVDPCPPAPPSPAASGPSAASTQPSSGGATPARDTKLTEPPEGKVTRFVVKPAAESRESAMEDGDAASDGNGSTGRSDATYWVGGVGAHFQRLEDEYV